jgi:RNA polymerase sigma-70 factor (ECF subfamily)
MEGAQVTEMNEPGAQVTRVPAPAGQPASPLGFDDLFRDSMRDLVRAAMYLGATKEEAEDAVVKAFTEMLPRWEEIDHPRAYARHAVLSNFVKERQRDQARVALRMIERGIIPRQEGVEDAQLTLWEDDDWLDQQLRVLLDSLPPAQREVMQWAILELSSSEIATVLGKTPEAVRRNLSDARRRLEMTHEPLWRRLNRRSRSPREEAR